MLTNSRQAKLTNLINKMNSSQSYIRQYLNQLIGTKTAKSSLIKNNLYFTPCEYEILFLLYLGKSELDIMKYLTKIHKIVSISTIVSLKLNIYERLGVHSNSELMDKIVMLKLIKSVPENFIAYGIH